MKAGPGAHGAHWAGNPVNRHTCARVCKVEPENAPNVPHVPHLFPPPLTTASTRGGISVCSVIRTIKTNDGLWTEFFPCKKEAGPDG